MRERLKVASFLPQGREQNIRQNIRQNRKQQNRREATLTFQSQSLLLRSTDASSVLIKRSDFLRDSSFCHQNHERFGFMQELGMDFLLWHESAPIDPFIFLKTHKEKLAKRIMQMIEKIFASF